MVKCPHNECSVTVEKRHLQDHVTKTCEYRKQACEDCGEQMTEAELKVFIMITSSSQIRENTPMQVMMLIMIRGLVYIYACILAFSTSLNNDHDDLNDDDCGDAF